MAGPFIQDLSARMRERHNEHILIRQSLEEKGTKSQLSFAAVLWVWKGTQRMEFTTVEEALIKLQALIKLPRNLPSWRRRVPCSEKRSK